MPVLCKRMPQFVAVRTMKQTLSLVRQMQSFMLLVVHLTGDCFQGRRGALQCKIGPEFLRQHFLEFGLRFLWSSHNARPACCSCTVCQQCLDKQRA
jgi:hypothetical protein